MTDLSGMQIAINTGTIILCFIAVTILAPLSSRAVSSRMRADLVRDIQSCRTASIDELMPRALSPKATRLANWLLCGFCLFALAWLWLYIGPSSWPYAGFFIVLLLLSLIDMEVQLLPGQLVGFVLWGGILASTFDLVPMSIDQAVFGIATGWILFSLPHWILVLVRQGKDPVVGQADIALMSACGAWLGPQATIIAGCIAVLLAQIVRGLVLRFAAETDTKSLPFGPLISVASIFVFCLNLIFH